MKVTDPTPPSFQEVCQPDNPAAGQVYGLGPGYRLPPAPGNPLETRAPGEPGVVQDQNPYPPSLSYSDLPHSSPTEWRLHPALRAVAAPAMGPPLSQVWVGDFTGAGKSELLGYDSPNWWLGTFTGNSLGWILADDTGKAAFEEFTWIGDFTGVGKSQVLVYESPNWRLGTFSGDDLDWESVLNPSGFTPTSLPIRELHPPSPGWIGDFTGLGRSEVLFYSPGDNFWRLGSVSALTLVISVFGSGPTYTASDPAWIGDFSGAGKSELLFYHSHIGDPPAEQYWQLGSISGNSLSWSAWPTTTTSGVTYTQSDPTWVGNFTLAGKSALLFYDSQRWWLGHFNNSHPPIGWAQIASTGGPNRPSASVSWIGDFTSSGKSELLFFSPDDANWWLGTLTDTTLDWAPVANNQQFGDMSWTGNFTVSGRSDVLFYSLGAQKWWLGTISGPRLTWVLSGGWLDPTNPYVGWDQRRPLDTLRTAARLLKKSGRPLDEQHQIRAMADLAVTGRLSYEALSPMASFTPGAVADALALGPDHSDAALQVVQRAQLVAWAIRGDPGWRASLRPGLGWIGLSGEDDAPHRPCNVPSLQASQHDLNVPVCGRTYTTRIAIVEEPYPSGPTHGGEEPPTFLPPDEVLRVSPHSDYVILFMAGDQSRLEEATELIPGLFKAAAARRKKISIISFDLIGWGYSARRVTDSAGQPVLFDQTLFPRVKYPANPPALQFVEDFVVALLETLDQLLPTFDLKRVVPIGGSLGGNLALRLARRSGLAWLHAVCAWSPASVWPSKASAPDADPGALDAAIASRVLLGLPALVAAGLGDALGAYLDRLTVGQCTDNMNALEDSTQRPNHFAGVFDKDTVAGIVPPQATMWYRDDWVPCKAMTMVKGRLDGREAYDQIFRRWHWRISQDQLVYSHQDNDPTSYTKALFLAAAGFDNYQFLNVKFTAIYEFTYDLAKKLTTAPGTSLFILDTGHSIDIERPMEFATRIFEFLDTFKPSPRTDVSYLSLLIL